MVRGSSRAFTVTARRDPGRRAPAVVVATCPQLAEIRSVSLGFLWFGCASELPIPGRRGMSARHRPGSPTAVGQNDMLPVTRTAVTVEPFMFIDQVP